MTTYEIRVQGHISPRRFRGFEGLSVSHHPDGETVLVGSFPDQSALFGLLNWLHDLGILLISVNQIARAERGISQGFEIPGSKATNP
jgi:hypothetical protein